MGYISKRLFGVGVLAMLGIGCGGGSVEVSDQPLAGTVGGTSWTFVAGDTDAFLSEGEDDFFALFYSEAFTACSFGSPGGDYLIVSVPKELGEYGFSLNLNMTFVVGDENLVATEGTVIVDEVTATTVSGGLHGIFDGDNEVDGQFQLTICADGT